MAANDIREKGPLSLPLKSGVPILKGQRVTLDADGLLAVAGSSELGVGVACYDGTYGLGIADNVLAVDLFNEGGSFPVTASGSITKGSKVQLASTGRVAALSDGTAVGIAREAATNGQTFRVIFY
ncbi:hypothetical protein EBZ80_12955 [bacterium]|nr:hypothetical protein [bacterium]